MFKKKVRRSRQFKKNTQDYNMEEARERRRQRREAQAEAIAKQRLTEEEIERNKKNRAKRRKRQRKYLFIFLIIIALCFVAFGSTIYRMAGLIKEKNDLEKQHETLLEQKERLEGEIANVNTPQYIEQQAREHLKLVMPGEVIYIPRPADPNAVIAVPETTEDDTQEETENVPAVPTTDPTQVHGIPQPEGSSSLDSGLTLEDPLGEN